MQNQHEYGAASSDMALRKRALATYDEKHRVTYMRLSL